MRRLLALSMLASFAMFVLPAAGSAQSPHHWFGVGVGAGPQRSSYVHDKWTVFALTGDIGVRLTESLVLDVTGVFAANPPVGDKAICAVVGTPPNQTFECTSTTNVAIEGAASTLGFTWGMLRGMHLLVSAGPGVFHIHGNSERPQNALGVVTGAQFAPAAAEHFALVIGGQASVVPNFRGGHMWLAPITVGFRFY